MSKKIEKIINDWYDDLLRLGGDTEKVEGKRKKILAFAQSRSWKDRVNMSIILEEFKKTKGVSCTTKSS